VAPDSPARLFPICVLLLVACLMPLAGCGGGSSPAPAVVPPPVTSVSLQPAPPGTMAVTATTTIGAAVLNASGSSSVTWSCAPAGACGSFGFSTTASASKTTYTAPSTVPSGNTVTITATSAADASASATITITPTPSADFFVAPNGSDSSPGTFSAPFATIAHAQQAVQGILASRTNSVVVMIRAGTYFQTQPLSFTSADSGTPAVEIYWQAYPGEAPAISGGMQITNWTNVNGNQWTATLPASAQYFEQLFYSSASSANGQQRRFRARVGSPPLVGAYYRVAAPVFVSSPQTNCPDLGQTNSQYECFDRFYYNATDPISASWANLSPPSPNPCGAPTGNPYPTGDIALYSFEQMGMSKMLINCIDPANQIIYLTGPIQMDLTTSGFVAGHRYLVENVKDVFTQPGQWFLDRSTTPWTLTYLANPGENPTTDTVIIPQMPLATPQVLVATNLQYVTFQGLTFEHDNFTVPSPDGYPYNRLDQNITSAVSCQNCQNVTFNGDTITQTAGVGIDFTTTSTSATTANNTFENGAIFDVASHGIRIGLLAQSTDTLANLPQFTTIQNNVIEGFGRVFAKGFGIAQGCNYSNLYTQNTIYDGYSGGINIGALNCPVGNSSLTSNNVASFNYVYNLGQGVTNDFGCVYFNTTPQGVTPPSGNQALNNVCHDVTDASIVDADGYGGQGIYIDNYTGLVEVKKNLVYRVSSSTVAQTCGPQGVPSSQNTIENNILAFGMQAIKQEGCTPSSASNKLFDMTNNLVIYDQGNIQGGCYSCLNGDCSSVLPATVNFQSNMYCYAPSGSSCTLPTSPYAFFSSNDPPNQMGGCTRATTYDSLADWQNQTGEDSGSVLQNPFSSSSPTNDLYSLSASPGVGFVTFDPSQAGTNSSNTITAPSVVATFPAQSYAASQF
jgi:hypothetical protein